MCRMCRRAELILEHVWKGEGVLVEGLVEANVFPETRFAHGYVRPYVKTVRSSSRLGGYKPLQPWF